jgi:dTDP-4-amino-4,6-dideoxygalactose transaminase
MKYKVWTPTIDPLNVVYVAEHLAVPGGWERGSEGWLAAIRLGHIFHVPPERIVLTNRCTTALMAAAAYYRKEEQIISYALRHSCTWPATANAMEMHLYPANRHNSPHVQVDICLFGNTSKVPGDANIVDAAHCLGSPLPEGEFVAYSFASTKIISCIQGGALVCPTEAAADWVYRYLDQGVEGRKRIVPGWGGLMSNFNAWLLALELAQLETIKKKLYKIRDWYYGNLRSEHVHWMTKPSDNNNYLNVIQLFPSISRCKVQNNLASRGIETSVHYYPLDRRKDPYYLTLPSSVNLTEEDVKLICKEVAWALESARY